MIYYTPYDNDYISEINAKSMRNCCDIKISILRDFYMPKNVCKYSFSFLYRNNDDYL